jgi:uncharacterized protein (TIGR02996 family)
MGQMETLRERLDDRAAWAVYADWLSSQGDPTGELCALELQAPTDRSRIIELKQARRDGRGDWHPLDVKVARAEKSLAFGWLWFAGHLRAVRLENPWNGSLAQTLDDVLSAPCGRFLRALELSQHFPDDVSFGELGARGEWEWAADVLMKDVVPSLEELTLGSEALDAFERSERSNAMVTTGRPGTPGARILRPSRWLGDVQPLFSKVPALRALVLHGEGTRFTELPRTLRSLRVRSRFVRASTLEAIGATPLPELERLTVWPGSWPDSAPHFEPPEPETFYGRATSEADLAPLLSGRHVPKLTHLEVSNSTWTLSLLTALAESPLLPRLQSLDVSNGLLEERDVDQLVRLAPRFRHLGWLDLSRHRVVEPGEQARLTEAFGPALVLGRQFVPEPDLLAQLFM